jgi:hypothetical protein
MPAMTETDRDYVVEALNAMADRLYRAIEADEEAGAGDQIEDKQRFEADRVRRLARYVRSARRVDIVGGHFN